MRMSWETLCQSDLRTLASLCLSHLLPVRHRRRRLATKRRVVHVHLGISLSVSQVRAKAWLLLYVVIIALLTFLVFAPVVPEMFSVSLACSLNSKPMICSVAIPAGLQIPAYVSVSYYALGFGTILIPSFNWYYVFAW